MPRAWWRAEPRLWSHCSVIWTSHCTAALQEAGRGPGSSLSCLETSSKASFLGGKNYKANVHEKKKNLLESSRSSRAIFTLVCDLSRKPRLHPLFCTEKRRSVLSHAVANTDMFRGQRLVWTLVRAFLARRVNDLTVLPSSRANDVVHKVHHLQSVRGKHATGSRVTCFSATTTATTSTTSL